MSEKKYESIKDAVEDGLQVHEVLIAIVSGQVKTQTKDK
jgi:hypothetical protein